MKRSNNARWRAIITAGLAATLALSACGQTSATEHPQADRPAAVTSAGHRLEGLSADAAERWSTTEDTNRLEGLSADAAERWSSTEKTNRLEGLSADAAEQWSESR